jgi:hypothetical protein
MPISNRTLLLVIVLLAVPLACLAAVVSFPLLELYDKSGPAVSSRAADLDNPFNPSHLLFDAIFLICIVGYLAAIYLMPPISSPRLRWLIIATPIVAALLMIFFYPLTSTDIYDLTFRAHITNRGGNPLTDLPCSYRFTIVTSCDPSLDNSPLSRDHLYAFVAWFRDPSPYGPAWELLAAFANLIAGADLLANLFAFKLVAILSLAACVALVVAIAQQVGSPPLRAYYIFAASPLVLFDAIGNGHNDLTLVAALLLGVLFLLRGWLWAALPAFAFGVLIKFIPLLLLPLVLVYAVRRLGWANSLRQFAIGAGLSLALVVAFYAPFWRGWQSIAPLQRTALFTNSLAAIGVKIANFFGLQLGISRTIALALAALFTIALILWHMRRLWQTPSQQLDTAIIESSADLLLYFAAFALAWWQPWYFLWALPFLALRPSGGRLLVLVAIYVIAFMYYFSNTLEKVKIGPGDHENWVGLFIFLPLIAATLWVWWQGRQKASGIPNVPLAGRP